MSAALKKMLAEPTPREALRQAIAERNNLVAGTAVLAQARDEAEAAECAAQADLDRLAEAETEGWARWAEHRGEHPVDVRPRKAELLAVHQAARRAAEAARQDYLAAEGKVQRDLPIAQAAVVDAAGRVLVAEAVCLGNASAEAVEAAARLEAALSGIKSAFASNRDGDGVAQVMIALQGNRSASDAERRRAVIHHESVAIRERWERLAERLVNDADATVEGI